MKGITFELPIGDMTIECVLGEDEKYYFIQNNLRRSLSIQLANQTGKKFLESLRGTGLEVAKTFRVKTKDGSTRSVNCYQFGLLTESLKFYAKTNDKCLNLLGYLALETLERRADILLGRKVSEEEYNLKLKARLAGKVTRRSLTDQLNELGCVNVDYAKVTIQTYYALELNQQFQSHKASGNNKPFRDCLSENDLRRLERLEDFIARKCAKGLTVTQAIQMYL
jgi:mRNA-degrading endonuclease YafQ of YafQ-DinJ toxin-antitoxin module